MPKTKYILIFLTFCATIAQGLWINALEDEAILVVDIPLLLLYLSGHAKVKQSPMAMFSMILTVLFMAWSASGLFFAPSQLMLKQELVTNIRVLLIFFALINFVNTKEDLQYFFLGFAIGLLYEGFISIHQWLRGPVGLSFLGEQHYGWQAMGTFAHPSLDGFYLSLMSVLTFRMAVYLRPKFHPLYVAAFFVGVVGLYATFNRANWLGFAGSMGIMFGLDLLRGKAINQRARYLFAVMLVVGMIGAVRYGTTIIERFDDAEESMTSNRSSSRKSLANDAINIMNNHPVIGVGLNNYKMYVNPETAGLQIVHCSYLLVGAELGYPGLIMFCGIIINFLVVGFRVRKTKDQFLYHIASACITGIIAFAIAMLPSPDYRNLYVKNHIWMVFAITLVAAKIDHHQNKLLADPRIRTRLLARKQALLKQRAESAVRMLAIAGREVLQSWRRRPGLSL